MHNVSVLHRIMRNCRSVCFIERWLVDFELLRYRQDLQILGWGIHQTKKSWKRVNKSNRHWGHSPVSGAFVGLPDRDHAETCCPRFHLIESPVYLRYPDVHRQSFRATYPCDAYFLIPLCLKEFLQFAKDEKQGRSERGRQTDRERGREILDVFSTLLHFSLAPRGFSEAFSKKNKQQCDGSNSSRSYFPAYPADYRLWYFSHYQPLVLRLLFTQPSKWISSFSLYFCHSSSLVIILHATPAHPMPPSLVGRRHDSLSVHLWRPFIKCT